MDVSAFVNSRGERHRARTWLAFLAVAAAGSDSPWDPPEG